MRTDSTADRNLLAVLLTAPEKVIEADVNKLVRLFRVAPKLLLAGIATLVCFTREVTNVAIDAVRFTTINLIELMEPLKVFMEAVNALFTCLAVLPANPNPADRPAPIFRIWLAVNPNAPVMAAPICLDSDAANFDVDADRVTPVCLDTEPEKPN